MPPPSVCSQQSVLPQRLSSWGWGVTAESGYSSHSLPSPLPAQMPQALPLSDRPQPSVCSPHPDPSPRPALLPHTQRKEVILPTLLWGPAGRRGGGAILPPAAHISLPHRRFHLPQPAALTGSAATGQERRAKVVGSQEQAPPQHTASWVPHRGIVTPLVHRGQERPMVQRPA